MSVNWLEEFGGNKLSVFLTLCFAFIGAVNVAIEIAKSVAKFYRATWGRTRIVCWIRNDGGRDDAPCIVRLWRLTNRGREPICIIADAVQIKGMKGTYSADGDNDVRKIAPDHFAAIPSNALGPHYVVRNFETAEVLAGGEHVCVCPEKRAWMVAEKERLRQPIFIRVAFITSEDKVIRGRWQKVRKR